MYNASMEPLARWIRREFEWAVPWQVYVSFSVGLLLALWLAFRYLLDFNWIWVPASVICLALGLIPGVVHSRKTRHRVKLSGLLLASRRGHLSEAIGPRAEQLNEAALDLEQIITTLRQGGDEALDRKGLMAQAKERFRRAFDLSLGAAAGYSLTREGAEEQIEADLAWLRQVRQHSEKLLLSSDQSEESLEHLHELEALVAAREEAIDELGLRG